ncbi:MAG: hypothetical protein DIU79_16590 [Actinobacteria bacterium]|nr:MAG: hypothetical protein DIU79_16590 [Actinomycetota bacterium]
MYARADDDRRPVSAAAMRAARQDCRRVFGGRMVREPTLTDLLAARDMRRGDSTVGTPIIAAMIVAALAMWVGIAWLVVHVVR